MVEMSVTEVRGTPPRVAAGPAPGRHEQRRFGLPTATALVVGSVIGTGVFALPSALAGFGPISLVAFALVMVGAIALALMFGALIRRVSGSGGPYLYAREAFGEFVPLLFMATVGLLFIKSANFGEFNAGGGSALGAISAAAAIALFAYIGIETASVAAGRVVNPRWRCRGRG